MINKNFIDLSQFADSKSKDYGIAQPFPNIVIDNLFSSSFLSKVSREFPEAYADNIFLKK